MAAPVRLTRRARAWLQREADHVAADDPAAALRLLDRIEKARLQLAGFPESGPPGLIPSTRRLVVAPYILTYRVSRGRVTILDIRHGRQGDARAPRP
jgi:plasmid stabilization system protein ParE